MDEVLRIRDKIDEIDFEIMKLLRRRLELAARIGEEKRRRGLDVLDERREREVLRRVGPFESIFKEIVKVSREVQGEKKILGIVGMGRMGSWMARRLSPFVDVLCNDIRRIKGYRSVSLHEIARRCDLIMVSTPSDVAPRIVKRVGRLMREDSLIFDIATVKGDLKRELLSVRGRACSLHPMFGPMARQDREQRVVLMEVKGECEDLVSLLERAGLVVERGSMDEHDRVVARTIGLPYLIALSLLKIRRDEMRIYEGTSFSYLMNLSSALVSDDVGLVSTILGMKEMPEAVKEFVGAMRGILGSELEAVLDELRDKVDVSPEVAYRRIYEALSR